MIRLRRITGSELRLLLAAALCLGVLLASSDSGVCKDLGKINFHNGSEIRANVSYSGPESGSVVVEAGGSATVPVKVGTYQWTAVEVSGLGNQGQMNNGGCVVSKDATTTVEIGFI